MPRQNITINEDTSWERLWASEAGGLIRIVKPWLALAVLLGFGWLYHLTLGHPPVVTWASIGMTLAGCGLAVFTWHVSRLVTTGRAHSCATVAAAALWLTIATVTGPVHGPTGYLLLIFGTASATSWNLRSHARAKIVAAGDGQTPAGRLSDWFADAAKSAGVPGATLAVRQIEPTRATAQASLPPGERTAADLQNRARNIESGMQFPPGSLNIAEDPDRADKALVTVSDPRLIRKPVLWPGPSRPGASIAQPVRPGIWQDGRPVEQVLPGYHMHIMGSSGAGKSIGACWNYAAEIITRPDAVILASDLTKGSQTWGPLEPALHRVEYDRDGVRDLFNTLHKLIPQRTTYLADHGLAKWVEGCGLSFLFIWPEETPDTFDALTSKEQDNFVSDVKALRSAGGQFDVSLQRSDWTQLPTIVRGQMASMCFGLYKNSDERFGLSEKQQEMGASPSSWGTDYPGMAYLHYPGTPPERIAMPMRTYSWGDDTTAAPSMAAYAAQYPADARPVDELTAVITGGPRTPARPAVTVPAAGTASGRPVAVLTRPSPPDLEDQDNDEDDDDYDTDEEENVLDEYLQTDDPTPALQGGIDDPIEIDDTDEPFEFDDADSVTVTPDEARALFGEHLTRLRANGKTELAARDFRPIMRPGMGRAWIHARLNEYVDRGELFHDPDARTYQFPKAA
jgi:hypothetical protein